MAICVVRQGRGVPNPLHLADRRRDSAVFPRHPAKKTKCRASDRRVEESLGIVATVPPNNSSAPSPRVRP